METLNGRKIAFPEVTDLRELFPTMTRREGIGSVPSLLEMPSWEAGTWSDKAGRTRFTVQGYLRIGGYYPTEYRGYTCTASDAVLEYIKNNMLPISDGSVSFVVHVWESGKALVTAEYDKIIGSAYLAIVDVSSLPV